MSPILRKKDEENNSSTPCPCHYHQTPHSLHSLPDNHLLEGRMARPNSLASGHGADDNGPEAANADDSAATTQTHRVAEEPPSATAATEDDLRAFRLDELFLAREGSTPPPRPQPKNA